MSDDERQVRVIIDYASEYLPEPQPAWPKAEFERLAYSRWAVSKIVKLLYENPDKTPMRIVIEFKCQMGEYVQKTTNYPEALKHCKYGYEVACDLEEILTAMLPF